MCVASFITSLVGWLVIPLICAIVGLVLGLIGLSQVKKTGEAGRGFGLAGVWMSVAQLVLILLVGLVVLVFFGFAWISTNNNKTISLSPPVHELNVSGPCRVSVVADESQPLRISTRGFGMEHVSVSHVDGVLTIKPILHLSGPEQITVTLGTSVLSKLQASESAQVRCDSMIAGKDGEVSIGSTGSSKIEVRRLDAREARISLSGSSEVDIDDGQTESLEVTVQGSGEFDGRNLKAARTRASVSGSGKSTVFASDHASATVSGSGRINVYGHPQDVEQSVSGSGKIKVK